MGPGDPEGGGLITTNETLPYTVYFENQPTATAAAVSVKIIDQLDPNLDWRQFRLHEIAFGDTVIYVPDDRSYWHTTVDLDSLDMLLEIDAGINPVTGEAHWYFDVIDPATGQPPLDPFAGFLPPNDSTGRGEGHVTYTLMAKDDLPEGAEITNSAKIIFDVNDPIITNEVVNIIYYPKPDLYVSSMAFQVDSLVEGDPAAINVTIRNQGGGETDEFYVQLYEGDPNGGGIPIGDPEQVSCIEPGMSRDIGLYWTPSQYGELDVYLVADYDDQIEEGSEDNNSRSLSVTVEQRCICDDFCDLNLDGGINPVDVVYMVNYVYKTLDAREQILDCPAENGDWNCDNQVSPVDVVWMVNYVYKSLGTGPCDPCNCDPYPDFCPEYPPSTPWQIKHRLPADRSFGWDARTSSD